MLRKVRKVHLDPKYHGRMYIEQKASTVNFNVPDLLPTVYIHCPKYSCLLV